MELSEVMTVFVPRYEDDNTFIMASHVDRLKQSACFTNSEMNCVTCHNPHHSVKKEESKLSLIINVCLVMMIAKMNLERGNNCVECHMPSSSPLLIFLTLAFTTTRLVFIITKDYYTN